MQMEFELAYFEVTVKLFNHYAMWISFLIKKKQQMCK